MGFLVRVCAVNGHFLPDWVEPQLERSVDAGKWPAAWLRLETAWGCNGWAPPAYRSLDTGKRAKATWWGPLIKTPRICPACLRSQRLHRSLWEIPLVKLCPDHGIALQNHCTRCGGWMQWNDLAAWTCSCGQPLEGVEPKLPAFSPSDQHIARVLAGAVDLQVDGGLQDHQPERRSGSASALPHGKLPAGNQPATCASYTAEGVMAALAFGVSLRETLREVPPRPRIGNFYKGRWKVKRGRVARRPPGWWEWRWLAGDDAERDRLSRLLLRWTFRYRAGWLVVGQKDEGLDRVQSALAAAPAAAFLDPLRLSIERALAACESPVQLGPAQPQPFYFNPRVMQPHMAHVTAGLASDWPELAQAIARSAPVAQPSSLVEFLRAMAQPHLHRGTFRRFLRELPLPDGFRAKHACELLNFHGVPHWTSSKLATTCQRSDCSATYCWLDHYVSEMNPNMPTSYVYLPRTR